MNNDKKSDIGSRIKSIRVSTGLTMNDFGKKLDPVATKGTVSNWEKGNYLPNNTRMKQIAELGNVSMLYLLEGKQTFYDKFPLGTDLRNADFITDLDDLSTNQKQNYFIENLTDLKTDGRLSSDEVYLLSETIDIIRKAQDTNNQEIIKKLADTIEPINEMFKDDNYKKPYIKQLYSDFEVSIQKLKDGIRKKQI